MEQEEEKKELFDGVDLNMFDEVETYLNSREENETSEEESEETNELKDQDKPDEDITDLESKQESEEDDDEDEDKNKKEDPSSQNTKTSSPFAPYAILLVEEGVLPNYDEEKYGSGAEGLIEAKRDHIQAEINVGIEEYKANLHPRLKWLQDNIDEGVSLKSLLEIDEQRVGLEGISEEQLKTDDSVKKQVARQFYQKTTNFSDARIDKTIKMLEDTGELDNEVPGFYQELNKINEIEEANEAERARQEQANAIKQQEERLSKKLKPLKTLDNIINVNTEGVQGKQLYIINEKLVNLKKPMMTDDGIRELEQLIEGSFDLSE